MTKRKEGTRHGGRKHRRHDHSGHEHRDPRSHRDKRHAPHRGEPKVNLSRAIEWLEKKTEAEHLSEVGLEALSQIFDQLDQEVVQKEPKPGKKSPSSSRGSGLMEEAIA
jgi:hypothetical protein